MNSKRLSIILSCLFIVLFAELFFSQKFVSMTFDEPLHIVAGYSNIITGDLRINTDHPPLIHYIEGLPLLIIKPYLNITDPGWKYKHLEEFAKKFMFTHNNNPKQILEYSRVSIIILTILLAFLLFNWTRKLFGISAALISTIIYIFEPNILAHGQLATTDMGFALFAFLSTYTYWDFYKNPTTKKLIIAGVSLGLVLISKNTAIFLILAFIIIALTTRKTHTHSRIISLIMIMLIAILVINLAHFFQGTGVPIKEAFLKDNCINKKIFTPENVFGTNKIINFFTENIPSPLPYYYVKGLGVSVTEGLKKQEPNLILGKIHYGGTWYYFVLTILVKTTIPFLLLLIITAIVILMNKKMPQDWQFMIIPPAIIFLALSTTSKQIGIRYILATFPFIMLFISGIITKIKNKKICYSVFFLIFLHILSSITVFPNYLSYYNELVGIQNGWRYFTDTNTDWGQDFDKLAEYYKQHPEVNIKYFGTNDPATYKLKNELNTECKTGMLAISAYYTIRNETGWLKQNKQIGKIGNSILLYNITNCSQ